VTEPKSDLARHPDRLHWNERYGAGFTPLVHAASAGGRGTGLGPAGRAGRRPWPAGPSGSALLAAAQGRPVTAVDVSEVALGLPRPGSPAPRAGSPDHPGPRRPRRLASGARAATALVLATGFWNPGVFPPRPCGRWPRAACSPGRRSPWAARQARPTLPTEWWPGPRGASHNCLLPDGMSVASQEDVPGAQRGYPAALAGPPDRAGSLLIVSLYETMN